MSSSHLLPSLEKLIELIFTRTILSSAFPKATGHVTPTEIMLPSGLRSFREKQSWGSEPHASSPGKDKRTLTTPLYLEGIEAEGADYQ